MPNSSALLIVHLGAMGDLVCIFPIIAALRRHFYPVGILCQEHLGRLAAAEGLAEAWFPIEGAWSASLFTARPGSEACRRLAPFSDILCFSASEALAAALKSISGARVCRIPPRPPAAEPIHVTEHARRRLLACGWRIEAELDELKGSLTGLPYPGKAEPASALLHPGAGSLRKRWPLEGFLTLARCLRSRGWGAEFLIGPAEEDLPAELERQGEKALRPKDACELVARLRTASVYFGNDSGVSHLAAWAGVPSVVIFGPSDPERWRPRGRTVEIVQAAHTCKPCFENTGNNCDSAECLNQIRVETVLQAFGRIVSSRTAQHEP